MRRSVDVGLIGRWPWPVGSGGRPGLDGSAVAVAGRPWPVCRVLLPACFAVSTAPAWRVGVAESSMQARSTARRLLRGACGLPCLRAWRDGMPVGVVRPWASLSRGACDTPLGVRFWVVRPPSRGVPVSSSGRAGGFWVGFARVCDTPVEACVRNGFGPVGVGRGCVGRPGRVCLSLAAARRAVREGSFRMRVGRAVVV